MFFESFGMVKTVGHAYFTVNMSKTKITVAIAALLLIVANYAASKKRVNDIGARLEAVEKVIKANFDAPELVPAVVSNHVENIQH